MENAEKSYCFFSSVDFQTQIPKIILRYNFASAIVKKIHYELIARIFFIRKYHARKEYVQFFR